MKSSRIDRINPVEYLKSIINPAIPIGHIIFDPSVHKQYWMKRCMAHDGTYLHTKELILKTIKPLVFKESFWKKEEPSNEKLKRVRYIVGWLSIKTEYGYVDVRCGRVDGETQTTKMKVRCIY